MRLFIFFTLLLGVSCSPAPSPEWYDENGEKYQLKDEPVAMMIFVPDCPWAIRYASDFQRLQQEKEFDTLSFVAVISGTDYNLDDIKDFREKSGYTEPIYRDIEGITTQFLKATISPEFFLLDARQKIQYRGAFDNRLKDLGQHRLKADSFYFRNAIKAMLRNDRIYPHTTQAVGCYLETILE
jgi:hypothetical protein